MGEAGAQRRERDLVKKSAKQAVILSLADPSEYLLLLPLDFF
jgi:hypothetical protein